jgi:hypothetical protein
VYGPQQEEAVVNMRSAIVFFLLLSFIVAMGSMAYAGFSYFQYRDLIPKDRPVGLLTGIRAWMRVVHDPHDPRVSDECKKHLKHYMIGNMVAIIALVVFFFFAVMLRAFGIVQPA